MVVRFIGHRLPLIAIHDGSAPKTVRVRHFSVKYRKHSGGEWWQFGSAGRHCDSKVYCLLTALNRVGTMDGWERSQIHATGYIG
jgi:hypothetical protein